MGSILSLGGLLGSTLGAHASVGLVGGALGLEATDRLLALSALTR